MMNTYGAERVINGTYGELWIDGDYVAEVAGFSAKIAFTKQDINQVQTFMTGSKIIGAKGTGTVKVNKVTSRFMDYLADSVKTGVFPAMTIISNLEDPQAFGSERVKLSGVLFDDLDLADWEAAKTLETSTNFTFTDFTLLDTISNY